MKSKKPEEIIEAFQELEKKEKIIFLNVYNSLKENPENKNNWSYYYSINFFIEEICFQIFIYKSKGDRKRIVEVSGSDSEKFLEMILKKIDPTIKITEI